MKQFSLLSAALSITNQIELVDAFSSSSVSSISVRKDTSLRLHSSYDRRSFLANNAATSFVFSSLAFPVPAFADTLLMDKGTPDVEAFKGGVEEAKKRLRLAILDIDNLLANYEEISKNGGGDNVRLYLGTQGLKSHMYGITKVVKALKEEADDIVEYTEASNEFEAYLFQAEGAAYQSLFAEHSSAKSTPESLLKTAKKDIVNMRKFMGDLAEQLSIKV